MTTDYGEKERGFIASLKEYTGRDLDEWMAAISAQNLAHRNDIIHWLRQQGFMFAKASWLERIHHNGGRPIYADAPHGEASARVARREESAGAEPQAEPPASVLEPEPEATPAAPAAPQAEPPSPSEPPAPPPPQQASDDLTPLLAKAKAYRPLAQHVIAKIKTVRPSARFLAHAGFVAIADPEAFAALGIGTKELRLHLELGDHPAGESLKTGVPGGGLGKSDALSHMIVLTDARQVDQQLLDLVQRAAANVNG
jgi:Domain of unknown function (DUF5655)